MTRNGPFLSFCPFWPGLIFQAWLWPICPVFGLSDTLYNLTICEKMSFVFSHRTVNMVYKRVCRNCPISSCGAKYLVRLANHLADVHQLDHIQRRQYLQEAKLQPKVKVLEAKGKLWTQKVFLLFLEIERKKRICNSLSKD